MKDEKEKKLNKLLASFGKNSQKNKYNQNNPESDVNLNHCTINVTHNNYLSLDNDKLNPHAAKENNNPNTTNVQFTTPLTNGPINTEAKITWPASAKIDANLLERDSNNNANCIHSLV